MEESFGRQCSKLRNTPEQLFHKWRTFSFDENTDTVDSYVTKISQCAAMLNYGKLQILELFKNTLASRLYWVLFPTDNLRDAIARVKRVLTKEKIDKQMTGQASSTPFMRVNDGNQSYSRTRKRGVTFDEMDAIERNSDCIDKLTSLVSKMNMKMDKREAPYKPKIYQDRPTGQSQNRQNRYQPRGKSFSRDRNQSRNMGNYNNRTNYGSNYRDRSRDIYRCDNRRNNYGSNDRQNNYKQENRRDSYRQDNRRDNYR